MRKIRQVFFFRGEWGGGAVISQCTLCVGSMLPNISLTTKKICNTRSRDEFELSSRIVFIVEISRRGQNCSRIAQKLKTLAFKLLYASGNGKNWLLTTKNIKIEVLDISVGLLKSFFQYLASCSVHFWVIAKTLKKNHYTFFIDGQW